MDDSEHELVFLFFSVEDERARWHKNQKKKKLEIEKRKEWIEVGKELRKDGWRGVLHHLAFALCPVSSSVL